MKKWMLHTKKADFKKLGSRFQIDPLLAKIMRNRGLESEAEYEQFLHGGWEQLHDAGQMKGIQEAAALLKEKIEEGSAIRIIGDYDVDGVNAAYILYQGLARVGADADSAIPDRMTDGYGINERLIRQAHEDGRDTIITCDNGIAAYEQIAYGKSLGMTIVVTDHHDVPYEEDKDGRRTYVLPPADAVVDPKQEDCPYPFKGICGAVVAMKFIQVLYGLYGIAADETKQFLQFAAMATVGDVMQLCDENRILVRLGLEQLRTAPCPGLRALMEENAILPQDVSSYHIGFVLGPCLNASGRLETAQHALKLLLAVREQEANEIAHRLKCLNDERKELTERGMKQAFAMIEQGALKDDTVLVVYLPDCHESLAGIIAGRIREKYYKPVLVFTDAEDGVKGSGRSIEGYHMYEELTRCKDLFQKYGGHPMAAGVSMPAEHLGELRRRLNEAQTLSEADLMEKVYIDAAVPFSYLSEELTESLSLLEPCGNGNPRPLFALQHVEVLSMEQKGRERKILKFMLRDGAVTMEAVYFGDIGQLEQLIRTEYGEQALEALYRRQPCGVDLAILYSPSINVYMGARTLQVTVKDICRIRQA